MRCLVVTLSQDGLTAFSATVRLPFDICKILHKKNRTSCSKTQRAILSES